MRSLTLVVTLCLPLGAFGCRRGGERRRLRSVCDVHQPARPAHTARDRRPAGGARRLRPHPQRGGVASTIIDARGLTHEDVNVRIGAADDEVLTPAAARLLRACLER